MSEVKQIGNYETESTWDNPQTGRVYSADGISPTLNTCNGGDRQPKIVEPVIKLINIPQQVSIRKYAVDTDKLKTCLREHKKFSNKAIAEKLNKPLTLVEHWFRKDNSFSIPDADIWHELKELLEIQTDEFDLPITEFIEQDGVYEKANRCYMTDGIAPTITSASADEKIVEPMIVASRGRNPQNPSDRTPGNHVEQRLEPNSQGICNTLTSVQKDNLVLEPTVKIKQATKDGYIECKLGGVADLSYPTSKTRRGRVQDNGDTCPTLTATETGICRIETPYRIRKLTPLECWRLMDFTDEDFRKAEAVNSNTQLYKQAGNSIVKAVLIAIFKQML